MATISEAVAPGYQFESFPNISVLATRERLSESAAAGFFAICEKWSISVDKMALLLGGMSRSNIYRIRSAAGTLNIDPLTRISYIVGIYKALHILLSSELADKWMTSPNDYYLFNGGTPLEFVLQNGIPGLQQLRNYLDSVRGGQ